MIIDNEKLCSDWNVPEYLNCIVAGYTDFDSPFGIFEITNFGVDVGEYREFWLFYDMPYFLSREQFEDIGPYAFPTLEECLMYWFEHDELDAEDKWKVLIFVYGDKMRAAYDEGVPLADMLAGW